MAKRKKLTVAEYMALVPVRAADLAWDSDEGGTVTLHVENKGVMKRLTQLLLRKPKVSHIHLDEIGSYLWLRIDGESSLSDMSGPFAEHFGERVSPTEQRMVQFFSTLSSYGFVSWRRIGQDAETE